MLSENSKKQLSSILELINSVREKEFNEFIIYDATDKKITSSVKLELMKSYYLNEFNLTVFDIIVKNYIVISWGEADSVKIINDFIYQSKEDEKMSF